MPDVRRKASASVQSFSWQEVLLYRYREVQLWQVIRFAPARAARNERDEDMAENIETILATWKPENWDAVTLKYLKSPEGAKTLALLRAVPDLFKACIAAEACGLTNGSWAHITSIDDCECPRCVEEILRAAIAKATGKAVSP
jgi:hypothetical protein